MYAIQLVAKKPDEWNIFLPNFDQWVRMGKDTRSGDKNPRMYLEACKLRWPEECQQT
jgi:hypothetical protein